MDQIVETSLKAAAVKFKWEKAGKTYDYWIPADLSVSVGDKVVVQTARGEATVDVMEIKPTSEMAAKPIIRVVPPEPQPEGEAA